MEVLRVEQRDGTHVGGGEAFGLQAPLGGGDGLWQKQHAALQGVRLPAVVAGREAAAAGSNYEQLIKRPSQPPQNTQHDNNM